MNYSIVFAFLVVILAVDFGYGIPTEINDKTSSLVINNGVTITGLEYRGDHPLNPFTNLEKDAKCSGYCACSGNNCYCSCYGCTNSQCIGGCLAAC